MTTELTLPDTAKAIIPKPTKNDVISAMVEIARTKWNAALTEADKALKEHKLKIQEEGLKVLRAELKKPACERPVPDVSIFSNRFNVRYSIPHPLARSMDLEEDRLRRASREEFDERATRAAIREGLTGQLDATKRVEALLNDPETVKRLQAALESINALSPAIDV